VHDPASHTTAPLIGITGRQALGSLIGAPPGFSDAPIDIYLREYAQAVALAGGLAAHLPLETDPKAIVGRLDALIIAGGEDVDPRLYGQAPGPRTSVVDPMRDEIEIALLKAARDRDIPVLGICRGQQLINVAYGGSLYQHLEPFGSESHMAGERPREHRSHEVSFEHGSVVFDLYGPNAVVNSFHHQAIDRLGVGITATGWASDGTIESIEVSDAPIAAVQWHPECFGRDPIFRWLVELARNHSLASATVSVEPPNVLAAMADAE
jgi:putative glutamine amidotransferase